MVNNPLYNVDNHASNETVAIITTENPVYLSSNTASFYNKGNVNYSDMDYPNNYGVIRPAVYLTQDINIVKGIGTEDDPYIIAKAIKEEIGDENINTSTEKQENITIQIIDTPNTSSNISSITLGISSGLMIIGVIILYKAKLMR